MTSKKNPVRLLTQAGSFGFSYPQPPAKYVRLENLGGGYLTWFKNETFVRCLLEILTNSGQGKLMTSSRSTGEASALRSSKRNVRSRVGLKVTHHAQNRGIVEKVVGCFSLWIRTQDAKFGRSSFLQEDE
jgi:hypothetical protein